MHSISKFQLRYHLIVNVCFLSHAVFACAAINDGLVAHYTFDDVSGPVIDSSGSYDATNFGALRGVPGKIGNAFQFDGIDDYVSTTFGNGVSYPNGMTISLWVKSTEMGNSGLVTARGAGFGEDSQFLGLNAGQVNPGLPDEVKGVPGMNLFVDNPSAYYTALANTTINDNQWHHVLGSYNGANLSVYVDGVGVSQPASGTAYSADVFKIGWDDYTTTEPDRYLAGKIDDVRIWDRALSPSEVAFLAEPTPNSNQWKDKVAEFIQFATLAYSLTKPETAILQFAPDPIPQLVTASKSAVGAHLVLAPVPEPTHKAVGTKFLIDQGISLASEVILWRLAADPPDSNFQEIAVVSPPMIPIDLDSLPLAHAELFQRSVDLRAELVATLQAMLVSMERAQGALIANDETWVRIQDNTFQEFRQHFVELAQELAAVDEEGRVLLQSLDLPFDGLSVEQVEGFQASLLSSGLPDKEVEVLSLFGLTESDVETEIAGLASLSPSDIAELSSSLTELYSEATRFEFYSEAAVVPEPSAFVLFTTFGLLPLPRRRSRGVE